MLHRFEIHGGSNPRVTYTSRHTANGVKSRIIRNDSTLVFFGPDPCKTIFGRIQSVYHQLLDFGRGEIERRMRTDPEGENINVTISPNFPLGEDLEQQWGVDAGMALVVKTDANMLQLVDNETLEPKKTFTYGTIDTEYSDRFAAAHHQYDAKTGEWFNFILEVFPKPTWRVFSYSTPTMPGATKVKKFQPVTQNLSCPIGYFLPTRPLKASYSHSFAITDNYVIIPNWSYYFSYYSLSILWYGNAYDSLYFDPNLPTMNLIQPLVFTLQMHGMITERYGWISLRIPIAKLLMQVLILHVCTMKNMSNQHPTDKSAQELAIRIAPSRNFVDIS
jgi:torulene dioxygenase